MNEKTYKQILKEKEYYKFNEKLKYTNEKKLNELKKEKTYKKFIEMNKNKNFNELIKTYRNIKKYNYDYKLIFILEYYINKTNYFNY